MNWLLFYLLAALHPVAFLVIAWKCDTWRQRLLLWALLPLPAVLYCWDYWVIKNEHAQMCAAEGGLKVLIQPENADRVRLVGSTFGLSAQGILDKYYPNVKLVEALTEERGSQGQRLQLYDAYTVAPNPKADTPWVKGFKKEYKFIFPAKRVEFLDPNMFEISVYDTKTAHRETKVTTLSKGGKVYAKYTDFVHWWTGIQYPDALPTWRCPLTPPTKYPDAPKDQWVYIPKAYDALTDLIFK